MKTDDTQSISILKKEFCLTTTDYNMKLISHIILLFFGWTAASLSAQIEVLPHQGGFYSPPSSICLSSSHRQLIKKEIKQNIEVLTQQGLIRPTNSRNVVALDWPLKANDDYGHYDYHGISNFVDHDAEFPAKIMDYNCGERSYDTDEGYNHQGTDFFLWPFAWNLMEANQIRVVAAAPGIIIHKMDGETDNNCDLTMDATWNAIFIRHEDGSQAWYGHLKKHCLTHKEVGETVEAGDFLGFVGSSGISSGPHLHLEVYDSADNLVDPFEGECASDHHSWWQNQRPYYDSALNRIGTHDAPPELETCPELDVIHAKNDFCGGDTVFFAVYLRDQLASQVLRHEVRQPDTSLLATWVSSQNVAHYPASYWYFPIILPIEALEGEWTYEVEFLDEIYSHTFTVCEPVTTQNLSANFPERSIFPNPVHQDFHALIDIYISGTFEFEIRDVMGRLIQKKVEHLTEGQHQLDFTVNDLPPGLYLLAVSDEKEAVVAQKFIKK